MLTAPNIAATNKPVLPNSHGDSISAVFTLPLSWLAILMAERDNGDTGKAKVRENNRDSSMVAAM